MSFCGNCGTPLNGEKFCPNCGAGAAPENTAGPAPNTTPASTPETGEAAVPTAGPGVAANNGAQAVPAGSAGVAPAGTDPNAVPLYANAAPAPGAGFGPTPGMAPTKKRGKLKFVVAGVAILLVIILAVFLFSGRSYEKVVDQYFKAVFSGDAEQIVKLVPEEIWNYALEEYDGDEEEVLDSMQRMLEYAYDTLEGYAEDYGVDLSKLSYEIVSENSMSRKDIQEIEDNYDDIDLEIDEGKELEVELSLPEEANTGTLTITVVKIGRSWYLYDM